MRDILHEELRGKKGTRQKEESRGWVRRLLLSNVCACFGGHNVGEVWTVAPVIFRPSFRVVITHARARTKYNPVALISEERALISQNTTQIHIITCIDG